MSICCKETLAFLSKKSEIIRFDGTRRDTVRTRWEHTEQNIEYDTPVHSPHVLLAYIPCSEQPGAVSLQLQFLEQGFMLQVKKSARRIPACPCIESISWKTDSYLQHDKHLRQCSCCTLHSSHSVVGCSEWVFDVEELSSCGLEN